MLFTNGPRRKRVANGAWHCRHDSQRPAKVQRVRAFLIRNREILCRQAEHVAIE